MIQSLQHACVLVHHQRAGGQQHIAPGTWPRGRCRCGCRGCIRPAGAACAPPTGFRSWQMGSPSPRPSAATVATSCRQGRAAAIPCWCRPAHAIVAPAWGLMTAACLSAADATDAARLVMTELNPGTVAAMLPCTALLGDARLLFLLGLLGLRKIPAGGRPFMSGLRSRRQRTPTPPCPARRTTSCSPT